MFSYLRRLGTETSGLLSDYIIQDGSLVPPKPPPKVYVWEKQNPLAWKQWAQYHLPSQSELRQTGEPLLGSSQSMLGKGVLVGLNGN